MKTKKVNPQDQKQHTKNSHDKVAGGKLRCQIKTQKTNFFVYIAALQLNYYIQI